MVIKTLGVSYDKGTGVPGYMEGTVEEDGPVNLKLRTSKGRVFEIPLARVYRREVVAETFEDDLVPRPEPLHVVPSEPKGDKEFANKLDIPSEVTKVYDADGSEWSRTDFSEFWYCHDSHYFEMDAYGPFVQKITEKN